MSVRKIETSANYGRHVSLSGLSVCKEQVGFNWTGFYEI
jgi:hypothetical protein